MREKCFKISCLSPIFINIPEVAGLDNPVHRSHRNNRHDRRSVDCCHNRRCHMQIDLHGIPALRDLDKLKQELFSGQQIPIRLCLWKVLQMSTHWSTIYPPEFPGTTVLTCPTIILCLIGIVYAIGATVAHEILINTFTIVTLPFVH